MLEEVKLFDWILQVDREATSAIYNQQCISSCDCSYCRNYYKACVNLPSKLLRHLEVLGIDPNQPAEIIEYCRNDNGTHFYSGIYNAIGTIASGKDYKAVGQESDTINIALESVGEEFDIGFTVKADFPHGFSEPVLQVEFFINLPWLLSEPPEAILD